MEADRVQIYKKHKVGLITVGILEIVFALSSISSSAATIALTLSQLWRCYYDNPNPIYFPNCTYYNWLYRFSLTAQGIWTGCMVIISASLNMRLATNPTKQMGSFSGGFSILSFILATAMVILEVFPVASYYSYVNGYYYEYQIWAFHGALLSFATALFFLTLTNVILSYAVLGFPGCCCNVSTAAQSGTVYNDSRPMAAYPSATVAIQQPIPTLQMQTWQQIPNQTNGQTYLVSSPVQLQSNLAFVPETHDKRAFNREATSSLPTYNHVTALQTPSHFLPQQTQVGTVTQRSFPAVQHGQETKNETWTSENSPVNPSSPAEQHPTNSSQLLSQEEHF